MNAKDRKGEFKYELRELRITKNAGRKERRGRTQRTAKGNLITNYVNYELREMQDAKNAEEERRGINYELRIT